MSTLRWRFEYTLALSVHDGESMQKQWHVFLENCTKEDEALCYDEVKELAPPGHPAHVHLKYLFSDTHDRVIVHPYKPFELDPNVVETMGEGFVDRVAAKMECCKVWNSTEGRTWFHYPGDSAR